MPKICSYKEFFRDYTLVENTCLRDKTLGMSERGLLVTMLSLPDNSDFRDLFPDGRLSIFNELMKLEQAGYLERQCIYSSGNIVDWKYIVYSKPIFRKNFDSQKLDNAEHRNKNN